MGGRRGELLVAVEHVAGDLVEMNGGEVLAGVFLLAELHEMRFNPVHIGPLGLEEGPNLGV